MAAQPKPGSKDVNVPDDIEGWIASAAAAVIAALIGGLKWIVGGAVNSVVESQEDHERRIAQIERNFATREDLNNMSTHIDRSFDRVHSRLDEILHKKL